MARTTFSALVRSFGGRPRSMIDRRNRSLVPVLPHSFLASTQIILTDLGAGTTELGMLPGNFALDRVVVLDPADAGTIRIDAPEYNGAPAVNLVADLAAVTDRGDLTIANNRFMAFGVERPITVTGGGGMGGVAVTGQLRIGLIGIVLDDSRDTR